MDRANAAVNPGSLAKARAARISLRRTIGGRTRTSRMTRTEIVSAVQRELIRAEPGPGLLGRDFLFNANCLQDLVN